MLGFIKRCTVDFYNVQDLKWLYCALVRPHLEYASCVWLPYYNIHKNSIERVQHKFLKHVSSKMNISKHSDAEILALLNLSPIITRHQRRDLLMFYNILNGSVAAPPGLLSKISLYVPPRTTRSITSFKVPTHRTNYGCNSFVSRASRLANRQTGLDFFSNSTVFLRQ